MSTVLSLVFVPSFYTVMDDASRLTGRLFGRLLTKRDAEAPRPKAAAPATGTPQPAE